MKNKGITGIGAMSFAFMPNLTDVQFASTISSIEENAFLQTGWLYNLYNTVPGYYNRATQSYVVDVEINGTIYNLHADENW